MIKRIIVQGGGKNLYRVETSGEFFNVYHISVGWITDDKEFIGKTKSLEDAISLIRSYSGREIKEIS